MCIRDSNHGFDTGADLVWILGAQNRHAGDEPHEAEIIQGVMGGAQIRIADAAVAADNLGILAHIAQIIAEHLVRSCCDKRSNRAENGDFTGGCKACGNAQYALLHDAELKIALGNFLHKLAKAGAFAAVGGKQHNALVVFCKIADRFAEHLARIF